MPQKISCNVVESKILVNGVEVEDVQKISLPELKKIVTEIDAMGMVGKLDIPDPTHYEAMAMSLEHNRGTNCQYLNQPGVMNIEVRTAIQDYTMAQAKLGYKSEKHRFEVLHRDSKKGDVERGNPRSATDDYSVIRYEEEVAGEIVTLIDLMKGIVRINGHDYTSEIQALLN